MSMYSIVKEAVIGRDGKITKDWSPNNIKAIYICRDFIFIAYHTKQPRVAKVDQNSLMEDLNKNGSTGSITNLLKQRQLSCLEEFYVDSMFQNYKGLFDLEAYANSLINTRSRLRFYGYCEGINYEELVDRYGKVNTYNNYSYAYALDNTRTAKIQYEVVENDTWYAKYNLRPNDYSLDANGGILFKYFTRVENTLKEEYEKYLNELKNKSFAECIKQMYANDLRVLPCINILSAFRSISVSDNMSWCILEKAFAVEALDFKGGNHITSISVNTVRVIPSPNSQIVNLYKKNGVVQKEETQYNQNTLVDWIKNGEGLLGFYKSSAKAMREYSSALLSKNDTRIIKAVALLKELGYQINSPKELKDIIASMSTYSDWYERYTDFIIGMAGFTRNSLLRVVKSRVNGGK